LAYRVVKMVCTVPQASATLATLSAACRTAWVWSDPDPVPSKNRATAPRLATAATRTTTSAEARPGSSRTACRAVLAGPIGQIVIHIQVMKTAPAPIQPSSTPTVQP
jgi:hypothetical protein